MKILQIVQKPQRRGAETFAFQLANELRRREHRVRTVYLYPYDEPARLPLTNGDCCLEGDESHWTERALGFHPGLLRQLRREIATTEPDIVQANGARSVKYAALARRLAPRSRWRLVYRNIGDPARWVQGWHYRLFYARLIMPGVDGVVGVSRATLDRLFAFYRLDIPREQIPRAIDPESLTPELSRSEARAEMGATEDTPVLVYLGSLTPEKRVDRLVRAMADLRESRDLQLWIIGTGPLEEDLQHQVSKLGLQTSVRFLGARADVASWLAAADLLLLASDSEGVPGVILEAGWLGLPCVATAVGGVPECVVDERTGLLVDPDDEEAFNSAITRLLDNPDERRQMGAHARAHVADHFLIGDIADRYVSFYERVLGT